MQKACYMTSAFHQNLRTCVPWQWPIQAAFRQATRGPIKLDFLFFRLIQALIKGAGQLNWLPIGTCRPVGICPFSCYSAGIFLRKVRRFASDKSKIPIVRLKKNTAPARKSL